MLSCQYVFTFLAVATTNLLAEALAKDDEQESQRVVRHNYCACHTPIHTPVMPVCQPVCSTVVDTPPSRLQSLTNTTVLCILCVRDVQVSHALAVSLLAGLGVLGIIALLGPTLLARSIGGTDGPQLVPVCLKVRHTYVDSIAEGHFSEKALHGAVKRVLSRSIYPASTPPFQHAL